MAQQPIVAGSSLRSPRSVAGRSDSATGRWLLLLIGLAVILSACGRSAADGAVETAPPSATDPGASGRSVDEYGDGAGRDEPNPPTDDALGTGSTTDGTSPGVQRQQPEAPVDLPVGIDPAGIEIPAIDVDADVVMLDLRGAEPEVPSDFDDAGWYQQTRRPGEIGPAVIAGHIDSKAGPAVFARLNELQPGDEIVVHGAGGESRTFVVTTDGQYSKDRLPAEVFGFDQPTPELRLITCGGVFDRSSGHYRDNFVIYASAVD